MHIKLHFVLVAVFVLNVTEMVGVDYSLTVTNGSGDGTITENTTTVITADSPSPGQHFLNWTTSDGGFFADIYSPVTTYNMPANVAEVTANFLSYSGLVETEKPKFNPGDAAASDEFGTSVDLYGDTAVVSSPRDDDNGTDSGSVYVFIKSAGSWSLQQKLTPADGAAQDSFGSSVAIYGDTIVVGALYDDDGGTDTGSVYVFTRSGATWTQSAKLNNSDAAASDFFGASVSISGNTIIAGAPGNGNGGAAYVFTGGGATWVEQQKLISLDVAAGDAFATSVSLSGDSCVLGSHGDDDDGTSSGSAYVFIRSGFTWSQQAKLKASDAAAYDTFGFSVDISGDTIVSGSRADDDDGFSSGSAYVFVRSGVTWSQQAKLKASDGAAYDSFGECVSVSGDTIIVGSYGDDDTAASSGSAYIFLRNGSTWSQQAKLNASDAEENDNFGKSVSIHGPNALVGAIYENSTGSVYPYDVDHAHTLTVTNGTGDGVYKSGTVISIVSDSIPANYHFVNWTTSDGGTIAAPTSTSTTYTMPANDAEVTSNIVIDTYTLTYNAGANGSITGTTSQVIDHGSDGSLVTATPVLGYHFTNWSDGGLTAARTDTNITADLNVTASFAINVYDVIYRITVGGTITGNNDQDVPHGSDATAVTATPGPGYHFVDWSDGVLTATRTDTGILGNLTVTANFAQNPSYILTVANGQGGGVYPEGSIQNISVGSLAVGIIFKNWTTPDGGVIADPNASLTTYTMPGNDATVTANLVTGYILTVNKGTGDGSYEPADVVPISADTPQDGMKFDEWEGDVANIADVNAANTTITMPSSPTEITATYKVDETTALKLTYGSVITVNPANTTGADNEFATKPLIYGVYTDPVNLKEMKSGLYAISRASFNQPTDRFKCEWKRKIILYDKTALRNANKAGISTSTWLTGNSIDEVKTVLNSKIRNLSKVTTEATFKGVLVLPPEITSVARWDDNAPVGDFHTESKVVIKGNFFGKVIPRIALEYTDPKTGSKRLMRLKVLKVFKYTDPKGKLKNSCMDVDSSSLTYGESEVRVKLPAVWTPGTYDLVLDNGIGIDTIPLTIANYAVNTPPVANDDTYNLQTGDSWYYLDILSNDLDVDSDSQTIIPNGKTSALGGLVRVYKGKIRYKAPRGLMAPIADSFTYTLNDGHGGVSTAATVNINFAAIIISSVENWNGNALVQVQNGGVVVIKGSNFGIKAPTVTLNYIDAGRGITKKVKCKVLRIPLYADTKGKAKNSYTDLSNGDSQISVEVPKKWWKGWSANNYDMEISNTIDSQSTSVTTTAADSAPVANNDNATIFSGKAYYTIDVLSNDADANAEKVKIILIDKTSAFGSKLKVDSKTNTIIYYRARNILCNFANDSFSYYLIDQSRNSSNTATVTVSGSLNP